LTTALVVELSVRVAAEQGHTDFGKQLGRYELESGLEGVGHLDATLHGEQLDSTGRAGGQEHIGVDLQVQIPFGRLLVLLGNRIQEAAQ